MRYKSKSHRGQRLTFYLLFTIMAILNPATGIIALQENPHSFVVLATSLDNNSSDPRNSSATPSNPIKSSLDPCERPTTVPTAGEPSGCTNSQLQ